MNKLTTNQLIEIEILSNGGNLEEAEKIKKKN
jgi:hypothetical protein